ncbi:4-oxalocrotonate tautomerase family protein [Colwelliaceae bacterium 6441]
MPYVNIKVTDEGVTQAQKSALIKQTTEMLSQVLGKDPASTFVVIDEVGLDNWGANGQSVTELRKT